jgi:hypothetical protein
VHFLSQTISFPIIERKTVKMQQNCNVIIQEVFLYFRYSKIPSGKFVF